MQIQGADFSVITKGSWSDQPATLNISVKESGEVEVAFITKDKKRFSDDRFDIETLFALQCWLDSYFGEEYKNA